MGTRTAPSPGSGCLWPPRLHLLPVLLCSWPQWLALPGIPRPGWPKDGSNHPQIPNRGVEVGVTCGHSSAEPAWVRGDAVLGWGPEQSGYALGGWPEGPGLCISDQLWTELCLPQLQLLKS